MAFLVVRNVQVSCEATGIGRTASDLDMVNGYPQKVRLHADSLLSRSPVSFRAQELYRSSLFVQQQEVHTEHQAMVMV